jgi:hypothetical protein
MNLLNCIDSKKAKSVSIIGMAKNTGKTVTLNHILKLAELSKQKIALTTIGLDGEDKDKVLDNSKPNILLLENMIVANAKQLLIESKLDFKILETTGIDSPLGEIIIAESKESGFIKLSGPCSKYEMKIIKNRLLHYNPDLILIDGALDRRAFSSPALTDATILATGAVTAESISSIVNKVNYQTELFKLNKSKDPKINKIISNQNNETKVLIIDKDYQTKSLKLKTSLNNMEEVINYIDSKTKAIYFNGALVNNTVSALIEKCTYTSYLEIIVNDATHIFINSMLFNRLNAKNGKIKVKDEINLLGITINPFSPNGTYLDPLELLKKISKAVAPIPCYEVVLNKMSSGKGVEDIEFFK